MYKHHLGNIVIYNIVFLEYIRLLWNNAISFFVDLLYIY